METKKKNDVSKLEILKDSHVVLSLAMGFEMRDVRQRYQRDFDVDDITALMHERELKRFLYLCGQNSDGQLGMCGPVDNIWHTFIIFTRKYTQFGNLVAGRYIHHAPDDLDNILDKSGESSKVSYERMLKLYFKTFNEVPPSKIWPRALSILGLPDVANESDGAESACLACMGCDEEEFCFVEEH